jgi:hypothetical protein
MDAHNPPRDEPAPPKEQAKPWSEQANAEAAGKAQSAAQAKTEELRTHCKPKASRIEKGMPDKTCCLCPASRLFSATFYP